MSENEIKTGAIAETLCPGCGKVIPHEAGYVDWCECGWNLKPARVKESRNLLRRFYDALGKKRGRVVFERLVTSSDLHRHGFTVQTALLFLAAASVQLFTAALLVCGAYLICTNYTNPLLIVLGLSLIALAVTGRPRLGKVPAHCLAPDKFPELHKLVARIASLLKTSPPDCLVIDNHFNARVGRRGLRQRKVLFIGLPLFSVLGGQEQVALIAHELAHLVNGDPTRGVFVSITLKTLAEWHRLLARDHFWPRTPSGKARYGGRSFGMAGGIANLAEFLTNVLVHLLSYIPYLFLLALVHLSWDEQQRAEYLADRLGAQVSGTQAFISMSEKLLFSSRVRFVVQRGALNARSRDVIEELQADFKSIPAREYERMRRLAALEETKLNATHPPTAFRIGLLQAGEFHAPQHSLSERDEAALVEELKHFRPAVNRQLIDEYRRTLYR